MALDVCSDCKEHFPGGEGLVDGRCPACLALYLERQEEPVTEPAAVEEVEEA